MQDKNFLAVGTVSFEELKKINEFGAEYWSSRDLQPLFGMINGDASNKPSNVQ